MKLFCFFLILVLIFNSFGLTLKTSKPIPILEKIKNKIKMGINYSENPNQKDFFTNIDHEKYTSFGQYRKLTGLWSGTYDLSQSSVYWINSNLDNLEVFKLIDFRPYKVYLKFNVLSDDKLSNLTISQNDVDYGSVNIDVVNDKQINYWAKAKSLNWLEIVRGKIFRLNESEIFTVFQTTVYEGKIPIYAFRGEVILRKEASK